MLHAVHVPILLYVHLMHISGDALAATTHKRTPGHRMPSWFYAED